MEGSRCNENGMPHTWSLCPDVLVLLVLNPLTNEGTVLLFISPREPQSGIQ